MKTGNRSLRSSMRLLVALVAAFVVSGPARADWQWTITPYGWLASVDLDATINDEGVVGSDLPGDELLSKVDMVLQGHFEGQTGRFGFFLDAIYLNLGSDPKVRDLPGLLPGTVELKTDFTAMLYEVGGIYNPRGDGSGFSLLYGTRIIDLDQEIKANFSFPLLTDRSYDLGGTLYDGMLGARWIGKPSERWTILLRGDASAGGTELVWNALGGVGYSFGASGRYTALAGYRFLEAEFKEDDARAEVETTVTMSGAFIALAIRL